MTYVTTYQKRKPHQLTWEDIFFDRVDANKINADPDGSATVTRKYETIPADKLKMVNVPMMIAAFEKFNEKWYPLFEKDRDSLYTHFKIPKKTGGFRPIDAPCDELQRALQELKDIFADTCGVLYHTSAYAYIENRCTINCVQKHANFKSQWFLKTDVSGFFPSTTLDFACSMLSMVFPVSEIMKDSNGKAAVRKALSLGFLNGGLPQGTVLSPFLTNAIMIPIDHALLAKLSDRKLVYTRYADDMHISGIEQFPYKEIVKLIEDTFREFGAPYIIKDEKTHYGNVKGSNWMLGLMLNGQHNITVGHEKKRYFKAALNSFILDTRNGNPWSTEDVRELEGLLSYYKMVEKDYFNKRVQMAERKYNINVKQLIASYLKV